jgi:hypothetical protein
VFVQEPKISNTLARPTNVAQPGGKVAFSFYRGRERKGGDNRHLRAAALVPE